MPNPTGINQYTVGGGSKTKVTRTKHKVGVEKVSLVQASGLIPMLVVPQKNAGNYPKVLEHDFQVSRSREKDSHGRTVNVGMLGGRKILVSRKTTKLDINRSAKFDDWDKLR